MWPPVSTSAVFGQHGQAVDGDVLGRLQFSGALRHCLFEALGVEPVLDLQLSATQGVGDVDEQLARLERLDDVPVGAERDRLGGRRPVVDGGEHDDGRVGRSVADGAEQLDARHARHGNVGDHQDELLVVDRLQRLGAAACLDTGVALPAQPPGNNAPHPRLVVHHQGFRHAFFCVHFPDPLVVASLGRTKRFPVHLLTRAPASSSRTAGRRCPCARHNGRPGTGICPPRIEGDGGWGEATRPAG